MAASHSSSSFSSIHSNTSEQSVRTSQTSVSAHSITMLKYADDHYPLITTIQPHLIPSHIPKNHAAVFCARQMAQIHNSVIRAINSSYNHCLRVEPGTTDAKDFLFLNSMICKILDHHHRTEDDYLFPEIERQLGQPGAMEDNTAGHEKFVAALHAFEDYVKSTQPEKYNGLVFRGLIESFAPDLIQHLHDEIPTLTKLYVLDSKGLMIAWKGAERIAKKDSDLFTDGPFLLGCQDNGFEIDGTVGQFPDLPWVIRKVVEGWTSRSYQGSWKFLPSELDGTRRLLKAEA